MTDVARKPRIAIMGEFSAGKSTFCNMLLRTRSLPERVTATRVAPVWMTYGTGPHMRVTLDGREEPVSLEGLDQIPLDETFYIRLNFDADILDLCEFIDCPGISDPNMDPEVWQRMVGMADAVIWLTHATQAWRQSEAAAWEMVPPEVQAKSILMVTRFDKLVTDIDKKRVMARMEQETGDLFDRIFPVSLLDASQSQGDAEGWRASGAEAVFDHLATMIETLTASEPSEQEPVPPTPPVNTAAEQQLRKRRQTPRRLKVAAVSEVAPVREIPAQPVADTQIDFAPPETDLPPLTLGEDVRVPDVDVAENPATRLRARRMQDTTPHDEAAVPSGIIPRRVKAKGVRRRSRPRPEEGQSAYS